MCYWDADSNGNVDANCYSVSHAYSYIDGYSATKSYTNSDSYGHDHAQCYANSDFDGYTQANDHSETRHNPEGASYPAAAPGRAAVIWFKERRSLVRRPKGVDWKPPLLECRIYAIGPLVPMVA